MEIVYTRPQQINNYQLQKEIIDCPARFTLTEGSTQSGKTVSHLVKLFEKSLKYKDGDIGWWVEPTYEMAKMLGFYRMKRFLLPYGNLFEYNESALSITLPNKGLIKFKSGDRPDNLYGETVKDIVIDEHTRVKEEVYFACYSRLTATNGSMSLIGNVIGTGNWGYRLARRIETGELPDWKLFKMTAKDAVDAGVMSQSVLDAAEATYPKCVFLEMFYGIPNENASNKFFYSFDEKKHVGTCAVDLMYPIYVSFDFNYNPICCVVIQFIEGHIYFVDAIKLENSNIYNLCKVIQVRYGEGVIIVTGDASGQSHSAMVKDNLNYYRIIKTELALSTGQMRVPTVNPRFEENQVLCNAVLEHIPVTIDKDKCSALIFDLKFAQIDNNGKLIKSDRNDPTQQLDHADCFRYYISTFHRGILKNHQNILQEVVENEN
jgi:hypothetical protein